GPALRRAMEDAWSDPLVNRRWQRVSLQLTEAECERLVHYAGHRGLAGTDWRTLGHEAATGGWALATRGYRQSREETEPLPRATGRADRLQRGGMRPAANSPCGGVARQAVAH